MTRSITIIFACSHAEEWVEGSSEEPQCSICHERQVATVKAPPPRFRGMASGSCVVEAGR